MPSRTVVGRKRSCATEVPLGGGAWHAGADHAKGTWRGSLRCRLGWAIMLRPDCCKPRCDRPSRLPITSPERMHSPDAPAATPTADSQAVDRRDLDSARARLQLPLAIDARWTACPAAANELVIDPDGSTRTCEHGATPLAAPDGAKGPLATWRGDEATTIRAQLAAGTCHCRTAAAARSGSPTTCCRRRRRCATTAPRRSTRPARRPARWCCACPPTASGPQNG